MFQLQYDEDQVCAVLDDANDYLPESDNALVLEEDGVYKRNVTKRLFKTIVSDDADLSDVFRMWQRPREITVVTMNNKCRRAQFRPYMPTDSMVGRLEGDLAHRGRMDALALAPPQKSKMNFYSLLCLFAAVLAYDQVHLKWMLYFLVQYLQCTIFPTLIKTLSF